MAKQRKPTTKQLSGAIRRTREALHQTQDAFAQRLNVAVMTLSKWERAVHQPTDFTVLLRLRDAAGEAGLAAEKKMFDGVLGEHPGTPAVSKPALTMPLHSISEWRKMHAFRIALNYLPEVGNAMEDASRPARELLDEIIRDEAPEDGKLDISFYNDLASRLDELAARKAFPHKFTTGGKPE